jgi:tetratricopeptide (TPR) repeat protein
LAEPWYIAKCAVVTLQAQIQAIQQSIISLRYCFSNSKDPNAGIQKQIQIQELQTQLASLLPQLNKAQLDLNKIENRIQQLQQDQTRLSSQTDASTATWSRLCDLFNKLGPVSHHQSILFYDQWIAEEPRLWQPYLARGVARLNVGSRTLAMEDFKRVESKLRLYGSHPSQVAIIMAIRAYSLSKQGEAGDATRLFSEAKKQDRQNWTVALVRGWSNLESKRYSSAKSDFQMALSLSNNSQAEPLEAMALLLAACPDDKIRNGEKAVKHAAKACELTNQKDWVCLDTLGAAYAEAGDFDAAVKSAQKATKLAPEDRQELIRERIEFYGNKVPYRWK